MEANQSLITHLGNDANAWLKAVDQALDEGKLSLARGLLFHPESPKTPSLNDLREATRQQGCSPS